MFKHSKAAKLAERHLQTGESLLACWKGSPNPTNPWLRGAMPLGLIGAGVNLAADLGTKHFYVFITDQRIIFERIKHGVATPRRTDEVYVWRLADVSNLRMESSDWKSPGALWTKWLRFESRSGPAAITNLGVRTESSPVLR